MIEKSSAYTHTMDPYSKSTPYSKPKIKTKSESDAMKRRRIFQRKRELEKAKKENLQRKVEIEQQEKELAQEGRTAFIPVSQILKNLATFMIETSKKYRDDVHFKGWHNEDPYKYLPLSRSC